MGKKIVGFSMTPLFPDISIAGAEMQLKKIALHLGEQGHRLTILTTPLEGAMTPFKWHENIEVLPILRFKLPYPEPYLTPLYHIANAMREVGAAFAEADVHYSHDGSLIFPYVYQDIPTVISLRTIVYPEPVISSFLFQGDEWILPSEHTRDSYEAAVGQFAPKVSERMHSIHNGFDWDFFRYTEPRDIFEFIPSEVANHPVVLFPHRPDVDKGIFDVVQVAQKLVHEFGWNDLRVLVPRWPGVANEPKYVNYYNKLNCRINEVGLSEVFVFHDWISEALIPEYYSLADVSLCIGNIIETFGNAVFESLGCGTPAVVSRVATYRQLLPEKHIDSIDFGEIEYAAAITHRILSERRRTSPETLSYLKAEFSHEAMVNSYADIILNAVKKPPLKYRVPQLNDETRYRLAPWCYISPARGIYHDFLSTFVVDEYLEQLSIEQSAGFSCNAVNPQRLQAWIDEGYVVPIVKE